MSTEANHALSDETLADAEAAIKSPAEMSEEAADEVSTVDTEQDIPGNDDLATEPVVEALPVPK